MQNYNSNHFGVRILPENDYFRLHITSKDFKGRIRKRLGNRPEEEIKNIEFNLRYELGKQFNSNPISKLEVETYVDSFIAMNVKLSASIFSYKSEFLQAKSTQLNKKTKKQLTKSTLSGYRTALKYFDDYINKKYRNSHPSIINEKLLDGFYTYLKGNHNYKTKLHTKVKGFIKYLESVKKITIDPSYKNSSFTEEYDNQNPKDNDIALTETEVRKLIALREKFKKQDFVFDPSISSGKIPIKLHERNYYLKIDNMIKTLDCFLLMISTGMYHADVMKSKLFFTVKGRNKHIRYRRSKNDSLCKAIPLQDDEIFIGKQIIEEYDIRNGSNFPLKLSLTHFDKHLDKISEMAGIGFKITNKMARKTFASIYYFDRELPVHFVQVLLGHKNVKDTYHYLRIDDDDIADEIVRRLELKR